MTDNRSSIPQPRFSSSQPNLSVPDKPLTSSRWASRASTPNADRLPTRAERLQQEKDRAGRLLRRLYWKAESLSASYHRAHEIQKGDRNGSHDQGGLSHFPFLQRGFAHVAASADGRRNDVEPDAAERGAETMFKLDFFEFYILLERYITHCLSVMGVHVSSHAAPKNANVNGLRALTNPAAYAQHVSNLGLGSDISGTQSSHRFHANVLLALDQLDCPLPLLGSQDVRIELTKAKDYRNRWKDADELSSSYNNTKTGATRLEELGLDHMFFTIFAALDEALTVVNAQTETSSFQPARMGADGGSNVPDEFVDDMMDLD